MLRHRTAHGDRQKTNRLTTCANMLENKISRPLPGIFKAKRHLNQDLHQGAILAEVEALEHLDEAVYGAQLWPTSWPIT